MIQSTLKINVPEQKEQLDQKYIGEWPYIPQKAFLFFSEGEDLIVGDKQKQWRKIFESGQNYSDFQEQNLILLQKKIKQYKIDLVPWFDKANKLRFLQANKFKITDTCTSIKQACKWRNNDFPIKTDSNIQKLLKSGCAYFNGRDQHYRPILIVDIVKFKSQDQDRIPILLMVMMEFMIEELMIEGQVQNYILIMDLSKFSMGMKSTVTKILSFTSNTYRGRLFASYLLGMPGLLKIGWDAIASKFVSENTLKKIKISKQSTSKQMWTHINQSQVQEKFGGSMPNLAQHSWPPALKLLNKQEQIRPDPSLKDHYIPISQYQKLYSHGRLRRRKIYLKYIKNIQQIQKSKKKQLLKVLQQQPIEDQLSSLKLPITHQVQTLKVQKNHITDNKSEQKNHSECHEMLISQENDNKVLTQDMIQNQKAITIQQRNFDLLFVSVEFLSTMKLS